MSLLSYTNKIATYNSYKLWYLTSSYDPNLVTYISALTTPLSSDQLALLNTFITTLKSGLSITNLSDAFDVMFIFANETSEAALKNLVKRLHDASNQGSAVFTQYEGYTGTGVVGTYILTGYNPKTQGINYQQNSASNFAYIRSNDLTDGKFIYGRALYSAGSGMNEINIRTSNVQFRNNAFAGVSTINHGGNILGFHGTSRGTSTTYDYYRNKTKYTINSTSESIYSAAFCALGNASSAASYNQVSFVASGRYLNSTEVGIMEDAFEAYMDAHGKGVIT